MYYLQNYCSTIADMFFSGLALSEKYDQLGMDP